MITNQSQFDTKIHKPKFVIEAKSEDEANSVNLDDYRFERYSETRDVYIFIKRGGK